MAKDGLRHFDFDLSGIWGSGAGIGAIVSKVDQAVVRANFEGIPVTIEVPMGMGIEVYEEICLRGEGDRISIIEVDCQPG